MTSQINILLWLVVGALAFLAAMRGRVLLNDGARDGVIEFIKLLPRIGIGVVGSGFVAEVLPKARSGLARRNRVLGVAIATPAASHAGRAGGRAIGAARSSAAPAPQVIIFHRLGLYASTGC